MKTTEGTEGSLYTATGPFECSSHSAAALALFSRRGEQVDDLQGISQQLQMLQLPLLIALPHSLDG